MSLLGYRGSIKIECKPTLRMIFAYDIWEDICFSLSYLVLSFQRKRFCAVTWRGMSLIFILLYIQAGQIWESWIFGGLSIILSSFGGPCTVSSYFWALVDNKIQWSGQASLVNPLTWELALVFWLFFWAPSFTEPWKYLLSLSYIQGDF